MRHPGEGTLRALVDGELSPAARAAVERHTAACPSCRERVEAVREDALWSDQLLRSGAAGGGAGAAGAAGGTTPSQTWADLSNVWRGTRPNGDPAPARADLTEPAVPPDPARRPRMPRPRLSHAAAALAGVLVVGSLALPPVRAAAAGLLSVFRAQRLQVITVSQNDVTQIRRLLASRAGGVKIAGLATMQAAPPHVLPMPTTLSQATALVDFPLTAPDPAPAGYRLRSVSVRPAQRFTFDLHAAAVNRLLASLGSTQSLPASLQQATVRLYVPATAVLIYSAGTGQAPLRIVESPSPELTVPKGVDVAQVRNLLLQLPFVPADLRSQLAAVTDWQHTALVPAPAGRAQQVTVGGQPGVFVGPAPSAATGAGAPGGTLVWISGGVVRVVSGAPTLSAAQAVAASMS